MNYESKAQCENFPIGVSATNFNCDFEDGELCLHLDVDLLDPLSECLDYVIELEFEEGDFDYTSLGQGAGEFELVSMPGDPVILRSSDLPFYVGIISSVCIEGSVQTPGMTIEYRVINPNTSDIVTSGTIQPDQEIVVGSPNTNTLLSSAIGPGGLLPLNLSQDQAQAVVIEGTLIVDRNYVFGSSIFSQSGAYNNIRMGEDAEIIVKSSNYLGMLYSNVYSCGQWNGIKVEGDAIFDLFRSEISDAATAIEMLDLATIRLRGSTFKENNVGIGSYGQNPKNLEIEFFGTSYEPNEFLDGNEGIHLEYSSDLLVGANTTIRNMDENGIYLDHTNLSMLNSWIFDSNRGILAQSYTLGVGFIDIANGSGISNCNEGITTAGYQTVNIENSSIGYNGFGIRRFEMRNSEANILNNVMLGNDLDVAVYGHSYTRGNIKDNRLEGENNVYLSGNVGVNTWVVENNTIKSGDVGRSVLFNNMSNGRIKKNQFTSEGSQGIIINGGSYNFVIGNTIIYDALNSSKWAISVQNCDLTWIQCNEINDFQEGVRIRGNCSGSDVIGNDLYAENGLQYGLPSQGFANTGEQVRNGNKFLMSTPSTPRANNYSMADIARNNRYIVASNNTQGNAYYPYFQASIFNWFEPDGWGDYDCGPIIVGPVAPPKDFLSAFLSIDTLLDTISYEYGVDVGFGVALKQYLYGQRADSVYQLDEYQAFTDSTEYEDALLLGDVIYDFEQLLESVAISDSVYEVWSSNFETHLHDLRELFVMDSTTTIDSSIYNSAVYASLKDSISTMQDDMAVLLQSSQEVLDNDLPILQSSLQSLTNLETDAAAYTKDIYLIAMDFLKSSFVDFTSAQKNTIRNISEHCMYKYESSVALARSLRVRFDTLIDYSAFDNACSDNEVNLRGTENEPKIGSLTVSPNPAVNEIQVTRMHGEEREEYRIYNTQGVLVDQFIIAEKVQRHQLFIGHLPSGMYWIKSNSQNRQSHATFIKP